MMRPLCGTDVPETAHSFQVTREESPVRLDRFLAGKLREYGLSRETVKRLIREGMVTVNGLPAEAPRQELLTGAEVRVIVPERAADVQPEQGGLSLLYRDEELLVLDKPAGIAVHPAPGLATGTLAHRLVAHVPELAAQGGMRPGIVHRLDKDSSGLMLVALTEKCRLALAALFVRHAVYKEYLALVRGVPEKTRGVIDAPVGRDPAHKTKMAVHAHGKTARSSWRVLYADPRGRFSLMAVRIHSGRTHQVRVHMRHIGHPLWGDAVYGGQASLPGCRRTPGTGVFSAPGADPRCQAPARQMLHAWKLGFIHPFPGVAARGSFFGKVANITPPPSAGEFFSGAGAYSEAAHEDDALFFCCPPPADFAAAARFLCRETLRVAVTGSPGCGKSSLLKTWQGMGIPVFSADAEVQRLYGREGDGQRLLRARFGDRFVPDPDGPVDKTVLGAALRDNDSLRREVESLIHPLVRHALRSFWQEQEERGAALAAAEIPLYLETDFAGKRRSGPADGRTGAGEDHAVPSEAAHVLVGVYCPFPLRRDRLMQKRGWTEDTIAHMESWQWPEDKKMAACDLILDNTGAEQDLQERGGELAGALFALRQKRADSVHARLEALWTDDPLLSFE